MIIKKYYKLIRVSHEDSEYLSLKNLSNETGTFKMAREGNPQNPNLEYSLDGLTWTTYDFTTLPEVYVAAGANIYFRGTNSNQQFNKGSENFYMFSFNKTCSAGGNIRSLFNTDPLVFSAITSVGSGGLAGIFKNLSTLTTASVFNGITTFSDYALASGFYGCTSLTEGPDFSGLTTTSDRSLVSAFNGCTSLTVAPDFSSLANTGQYCLANGFHGCTSLTEGPDFSSLTTVGDYSLRSCFIGCSNLVKVKTPNIQNITTTILDGWLYNAGTSVPAGTTKTVNVPTGATITTDSTSGIPTGWTRVDY